MSATLQGLTARNISLILTVVWLIGFICPWNVINVAILLNNVGLFYIIMISLSYAVELAKFCLVS